MTTSVNQNFGYQSRCTSSEGYLTTETENYLEMQFLEEPRLIPNIFPNRSEESEDYEIQISDQLSCKENSTVSKFSNKSEDSLFENKRILFENLVSEYRDDDSKTHQTFNVEKKCVQNKGEEYQKRIASFQNVDDGQFIKEIHLKSCLNKKLQSKLLPNIQQLKKKKIPSRNFKKYLRRIIDSYSNTCVLIGTVKFSCSLTVLQCYSDLFVELSDELLIKLPDSKISAKAFDLIYKWMIKENTKVNPNFILEIFEAAYFLKIRSLIRQCWTCFDDESIFSENNAFLFYIKTGTLKQTEHMIILRKLLLTRIHKFFMTLVVSSDYVALNQKEIVELLSSNQIAIHNEIEIFFAAIRWLNADWEHRKEYLTKIVECVRFKSIQLWFLIFLNRGTSCERINRVITHPVIQHLISDSITYITAVLYWGGQGDLESYLNELDLSSPDPRRSVEDTKIHFYSEFQSLLHNDVSYEAFISYLKNIRNAASTYWCSLKYKENAHNLQNMIK